MDLKGRQTKFKKGTAYRIQELTFEKKVFEGRYTHKEDCLSQEPTAQLFVFDDGNLYYKIYTDNCINALYVIEELKQTNS